MPAHYRSWLMWCVGLSVWGSHMSMHDKVCQRYTIVILMHYIAILSIKTSPSYVAAQCTNTVVESYYSIQS